MDYTPDLVDYWLRNFELLTTLAETPQSSAHLLSPECRSSDHACSNGRPVGIKNIRQPGDPMRYVDLLADLRSAAAALPAYSLESRVVLLRMQGYAPLGELRVRLAVDMNRLCSAYRGAVKMMAASCGWFEPNESV